MRELAAAVALAFVGAAATGCRRQPPEPLMFHLELAKTKIKAGEYPWYRYSVTNVGRKPIGLDSFMCWQQEFGPYVEDRVSWTNIVIEDAEGRRVYPPDGRHKYYWTNECGGDTGCSCKTLDRGHGHIVRYGPEKSLAGGATFYATPSIVGPVEPETTPTMDHHGDPRRLPWWTAELPPERRQELEKTWKIDIERHGYLLGDPTFVSTMTAKDVPYIGYPKALYPGYRVYDHISFDNPGRYRMAIFYRPFGGDRTYEQVKKDYLVDGMSLRSYGWPEETRVFDYSTGWVYFEVEAPPFPEHLFKGKKFKTKCDRLRNEWERRALRDARVWEGDPYDKKLIMRSPKELPQECR